MNVFQKVLGNWIQIIDDQNTLTIENYDYNTGVIEERREIIALNALP